MSGRVVVEVPLRWGDMDAQGHLNNGAYVDYLQQARVGWLLGGPHPELLGSGILVVRHQIEYRAPVVYGPEPMVVELSVAAVGAARLELAYGLRQRGSEVARARTVLAAYDLGERRLRRWSAGEREWLTSAIEPSEPFRALPEWPADRPGTGTDVHVRWSDLDAYGHVNNVTYFEYLQQARVALVHELAADLAGELIWVVVRQDLDYLAQLEHRIAPYRAEMALLALGTSSCTLGCAIRGEGVTYAIGRTVLVCADVTGRPLPIPDAVRAQLSRLGAPAS